MIQRGVPAITSAKPYPEAKREERRGKIDGRIRKENVREER
jgi:hypothetical protein